MMYAGAPVDDSVNLNADPTGTSETAATYVPEGVAPVADALAVGVAEGVEVGVATTLLAFRLCPMPPITRPSAPITPAVAPD